MSNLQRPHTIVYLDRGGLPSRIQIPSLNDEHRWINYPFTHASDVINRSKDADVLVVNKIQIGAKELDACTRVKHIAVTATGVNVIDLEACEARGVSVSHIPSYAAVTVSEHVIGSAIVLRREILRYAQCVSDGRWQHSDAFCLFDKPFRDINQATMGLIGLGDIGQATAQRAHALGMNVLFCARSKRSHPFARQVSLNELLQQSDIVSVHCSLNDSTHNLIGTQELALMPEHGILINTARGGIVHEQAVVNAILKQRIAGVAFDVMIEEPPKNSAPLLSIADQPNVLITPHIAWASDQAMQYLINTVRHNIDAFIQGQPINLVSKPHNQ